jgi:anti-sigma regulatory factor (Ser/Thr protein kinase)
MLRDADMNTAELLVSELVTNAAVHAGTPVDVVVSVLGGTTLEVEVSDGSVGRPTNRRRTQLSSSGRGLPLIDALSDCRGLRASAGGKTVWFQLRPEMAGRSALSGPGMRSA